MEWPHSVAFCLSPFILGNIKGAGKSAVRYNERLKDISIERLYNINNSLIY